MGKKETSNRRKGDIIWVELGQHPGRHIQSGRRPCMIVNTNKNRGSTYTVLPGTTKDKIDGFPVHVRIEPHEIIGSLNQITVFMAEQMVTIDENQIILKAGRISEDSDAMKRVQKAIRRQLDLN